MHLKVLFKGRIAFGCGWLGVCFCVCWGRGCGRLEIKYTLVSTVRQVGGFLLQAQQCCHCYQIPIRGPPILGDAEVICRDGTKKSQDKSEPVSRDESLSAYL